MKEKEMQFILQKGEGLEIEFKEGFDSKGLAKEMVAFANSEGGKIFLGVSDKGEVGGVQITNRLKSDIQDLARNCDPPIDMTIGEFENVLIINVEGGINKPYRCLAGFYLRQGASSQKLSTDEIRSFFNEEGKIFFDDVINSTFNFNNGFDKTKFEKFLRKAKLSRNIPDEDISEDTISNYYGVIAFLFRNLRLEYKIETVGPRKEILEVPDNALREAIINAIINAIVHRDYNEKGANIQIDIFDDRIEISNPGGLVSAIKKEDFGKRSFSRNPLLFNLFKRIELVEKVGSGIARMRESMKKIGLSVPKFELSDFFTVIFKRPSTPQKTPQKPTELEQKILNLIKKKTTITRLEIARELSISADTVKEYLDRLKEKGFLIRVGGRKHGSWQIKEVIDEN